MSRQEILDYIVKNNLKEEVKEKFGRAYNTISSALLEDFINTHKSADKIKKGMSKVPNVRNDIFKYIKDNNLQKYITERTCKPYSSVNTDTLYRICVDWEKSQTNKRVKECYNNVNGNIDVKARQAIKAMAEILNLTTVLKYLD